MKRVRILLLVSVALLAIITTSIPAAAATCASRRTSITITLDDDAATQANGTKLGQFDCWMPKPATSAVKDLCEDGIAVAHKFSITLANQCGIPVRMMLRLKGGGSLHFQEAECGNGAVVFDGVVSSTPVSRSCTSATYPAGSGSKSTEYEVVATHVDPGTGPPQPIAPPVAYDPEIAVKDAEGFKVHPGLLAVAIIGGGLLVWLVVRRSRRPSVR